MISENDENDQRDKVESEEVKANRDEECVRIEFKKIVYIPLLDSIECLHN